eukprot:TRINITY_DN529_c0_g1_i3.p1 TRINITY_DN529_c0_g1~~TRINITY_DN529_c0_g1_i3.p1  ORF type:complete len:204 (+),score=52.94 TRINITY_DN529_c0_g1_i3:481-1092(+)
MLIFWKNKMFPTGPRRATPKSRKKEITRKFYLSPSDYREKAGRVAQARVNELTRRKGTLRNLEDELDALVTLQGYLESQITRLGDGKAGRVAQARVNELTRRKGTLRNLEDELDALVTLQGYLESQITRLDKEESALQHGELPPVLVVPRPSFPSAVDIDREKPLTHVPMIEDDLDEGMDFGRAFARETEQLERVVERVGRRK